MKIIIKQVEKAKKNNIGIVSAGGDYTLKSDNNKYYTNTEDTKELFEAVQEYTSKGLYPNYDCNAVWFTEDQVYAEWEETNGDDVVERKFVY